MKKMNKKALIFFIFQMIFLMLTFVGGVLLLAGKINNAGMSICCSTMSIAFGSLCNSAKNKN